MKRRRLNVHIRHDLRSTIGLPCQFLLTLSSARISRKSIFMQDLCPEAIEFRLDRRADQRSELPNNISRPSPTYPLWNMIHQRVCLCSRHGDHKAISNVHRGNFVAQNKNTNRIAIKVAINIGLHQSRLTHPIGDKYRAQLCCFAQHWAFIGKLSVTS